jgi:hypothetical protein
VWSLRTFARVMTGRKPTSRTATAGGFCLPARAHNNFRHYVIFGMQPAVSYTDLRLPNSANASLLPTAN